MGNSYSDYHEWFFNDLDMTKLKPECGDNTVSYMHEYFRASLRAKMEGRSIISFWEYCELQDEKTGTTDGAKIIIMSARKEVYFKMVDIICNDHIFTEANRKQFSDGAVQIWRDAEQQDIRGVPLNMQCSLEEAILALIQQVKELSTYVEAEKALILDRAEDALHVARKALRDTLDK